MTKEKQLDIGHYHEVLREMSALQEHDHRDNGHRVRKGSDNQTKACTNTSQDSPPLPPKLSFCEHLRNYPLAIFSSASTYSSSLCTCPATESSQLNPQERTTQTSTLQGLLCPSRIVCLVLSSKAAKAKPADKSYSRKKQK